MRVQAFIYRTLKQSDSSFVSQPPAQKHGRIHRNGQHWSRGEQRCIVIRSKTMRIKLYMDLKTSTAGLRHDVIVNQLQFVNTFY